MAAVKYWETSADNLTEAGWSRGCVSAIDSNGRTIWIADAHRDDIESNGAMTLRSSNGGQAAPGKSAPTAAGAESVEAALLAKALV